MSNKTKMKNLVPAAAMSLALVGLSGMKAYAADTDVVPTTPPDTNEPPKEVQEQPAATQSSADINSASKGEVTDGKNTLTVNPDESGNNGTLDVTTTPGETTTTTTPPVTSTTTNTTENPDGSTDTTTTTTTTSTTTTTEETTTDITGKITGDKTDPEQVTGDEKDEVVDELDKALEEEANKGQTDPDAPKWTLDNVTIRDEETEGTKVGEFEAVGKSETSGATKDAEGNEIAGSTTTTTTVTFEKVVEGTPTEGAGLTQEEFGKIVNEQFGLNGVEFTTFTENTITYRDPVTGADVTVKLETSGTSTTTTTYQIKVSQTKTVVADQTETGNTEVGGSEGGTTVYDPVDPEKGWQDDAELDSIIEEILNANLEDKTVTKTPNQDGSITVTDGKMQYVITTTETVLTADQIANVSNEHLVQLLGNGYKLKDGKIVTVDGEYEVKVTTDKLNGKAVVRTIKVTDLKDHESDVVTGEADKTDDQLKKNAAANAAETAATEQGLQTGGTWSETTLNNDGTYTRTYTVGGKTYTFTMTADDEISSSSNGWTTNVKDSTHSSEQTTTNTGNAHVSGETIAWSGTETDEKITVTKDETTGEVSFEVNAVVGGQFDGAAVKSITNNSDGTITVITEQSGTNAEGKPTVTTKTYTFTLGTMTEDEKAAFMRENGLAEGDTATLTGLSKVTWTIDEKVTTTTPAVEDSSTTDGSKNGDESKITNLPTGVTKNDSNNTYTYDDVTLTKGDDGKWHGVSDDGKTTYTIEETVATIEDAQIVALLRQNYDIPENVNVIISGNTASYTNSNGEKVTINFTGLTGTNVTLKIDVKDQIESTVNEAHLKTQIAAWVHEQVEKYGKVTVGDVEITQDTFEEKIGEIIELVVVNNTVDFKKMSEDEIINMLQELEQQSLKNGNGYFNGTSYGQGTAGGTNVFWDQWNGYVKDFYGVKYVCIWHQTGRGPNEGYWAYHEAEWNQRQGKYVAKEGSKEYVEDENHVINLPIPENQGPFNTELGHLDLVSDGKLTLQDNTTHDCVVLGDGLNVFLGSTAQGVYEGTGEQAHLKSDINWDDLNKLYQYERASIGDNTLPQDYLNRDNKFYKVTGTVAYGFFEKYDRKTDSYVKVAFDTREQAEATGLKYTIQIAGKWYAYDNTTTLTTYGYLGAENNACELDYDLKLNGLKLVNGEVTSINEEVNVWSSDVSATKVDSGWLYRLVFGDIVTTTPGTPADILIVDKDRVSDSGLAGKWTITQKKDESDLTDSEGGWLYQGSDSTSYDSYKTWVARDMPTLTAKSTEYKGTLRTEYTKPGSTTYGELQVGRDADGQDSVTKTLQTVRDLVASLQSTSVQQTTNNDTTTNTEHQAPREEEDIPDENPPLVNTPDEDPPEVDVPEEEPPLVDMPEEETPLVDMPEEETPLVDMPEEELPLVDMPEETPPMADMPVEAPPVVDVADPAVPLADVPQTGDNVMLRVAAAVTGLFSTLGLAALTLKKREDEEN